jgi:hypothetical protein
VGLKRETFNNLDAGCSTLDLWALNLIRFWFEIFSFHPFNYIFTLINKLFNLSFLLFDGFLPIYKSVSVIKISKQNT